jgi:hypothetical protein
MRRMDHPKQLVSIPEGSPCPNAEIDVPHRAEMRNVGRGRIVESVLFVQQRANVKRKRPIAQMSDEPFETQSA